MVRSHFGLRTSHNHPIPMLALSNIPREERLQQEAEAKRKSNEIDEQLRLEGIAARKRKAKERKILLLGQSESGKSTLLKQFQLLHSTPGVFDAERASWRLIIFHNLVRSILGVLDEIVEPVHSNSEYPDNDQFWQAHRTTFKTMRVRLSPLSQIADLITNKLSPESSPTASPSSAPPAEPGSDWTLTANSHIPSSEISVLSSFSWKSALKRLHVASRSPRPSAEYSIDFDNENDPGRLLVAFHEDLLEFCRNKVVWEMLKRRKVRVENISGFFLDDIDRITKPRYVPTDDDILKARLKTLGVTETQCVVNSGTEKVDVGGARYQRAAWAPHFDDVNCIIFLAPISAFDQVLAEDPSINRLEDSLAMWRDLCKNKILRGASIVLFLNKCDLLRAKLEAGVKLNQFLVSYGDRPNDYENVTKTIKAKFDRIRYDSSRDAQVFTHFITATDTHTTSIAINAVRDKIMRENLQTIGAGRDAGFLHLLQGNLTCQALKSHESQQTYHLSLKE
ncbi:Guanine nucleotide-binding protein alpha-4 subunit [Ceratobasidium theobromae]|uniref:Guanine nucleotide-binding protein alpha-4 subunit n=1 Tax=Ceratobasidium theobromae TaxID=1582974 RepID=A0A5N5QVB6_9AGAM|nr:Guanine nucleotide-binding protein alpha-4 subunit [Ceratobasidium theobromae]